MILFRPMCAALLLLAVCAAPGCGSKRSQQACRLEDETVLVTTHRAPSAVALASLGKARFAAAWSAGDETWCARLGARGEREGELLRVNRTAGGAISNETDDGGARIFWPNAAEESFAAEYLAVAPLPSGGAVVGVLERRSESRPGGAFAAFLGSPFNGVDRIVALGPAGPFSSRIAVVPFRGRSLVAWHDAAVEQSAIHVAAVDQDGTVHADVLEIPGGHPAFSPSLAIEGDAGLLVWTESRSTNASPHFDILAAELLDGPSLGPISTIATSRYLDPSPSVIPSADGFAAAFRDDRDDDDAPEYYYADLDRHGGLRHGPARISRADGPEGPRLARLGKIIFGAQVRSFSASLLVGMNRFDIEGDKRGGEFQVYADKSDFTRVDIAPGDGRMLLLYGEDSEQGKRDSGGRILTGAVTCRE